jgi:hypothetical protein
LSPVFRLSHQSPLHLSFICMHATLPVHHILLYLIGTLS